jgi:hypothetical protein
MNIEEAKIFLKMQKKVMVFIFLYFFHCYSLFEIWGWKWVLKFKCLIFWNWRAIMNAISIFSFFTLHVAIVSIFLMIFSFRAYVLFLISKLEGKLKLEWLIMGEHWMNAFVWVINVEVHTKKGGNGFKSTPMVHYSCVLVWPIYMMQNPIFYLLMKNRFL